MKKHIAVLILTASLFACNSNDDKIDDPVTPAPPPTQPPPTQPPVEPPTTIRNVTISFAADFEPSNSSSELIYTQNGEVLLPFDDLNGLQHHVRTDSYILTITDATGIRNITDISIAEGASYTYEVDGDAQFALTHIDLDSNADGITDTEEDGSLIEVTKSYFTANGQASIVVEDDTLLMGLYNEYYAMLSMETEAVDGIEMTINGNAPAVSKSGFYNYLTGGEASVNAIGNGVMHSEKLTELKAATVFNIGPKLGDDNFTLIVHWAYPADTYSGPGVIDPKKILGADKVEIDDITGAVSGITSGKSVVMYHPTSGYFLNEYKDFIAVIEFESEAQVAVNIYLEKDGQNIRADYYPATGEVRINDGANPVAYSFEEFATSLEYKDYIVRSFIENYADNLANGTDLQSVRGNFFARLGDSTYQGSGDKFIIKEWSLAEPNGLPLNQIKRATNLTSIGNAILGDIEAGTPVIAYNTVRSNTVLADYSWSFDTETLSGEEFINIYLNDNGVDVNATLLVGSAHGFNQHKYEIRRDDTSEWAYLTEAEFKAQYAQAEVRQWAELTGFIDGFVGNFVWRSNGSDHSLPGNFTITEFEVININE